MLHRKEFAAMSESLQSLRLADEVIVALARSQKLGAIRNEDRPLLKQVDDFFAETLKSFNEQQPISRESAQAAAALADVTSVLEVHTASPQVMEAIRGLQQIARKLHTEGNASENDVKQLKAFFTSYGYDHVARTNTLSSLMRSEAAGAWHVTNLLLMPR